MKRLAALAIATAFLAAGCGKKEEAPAAQTAPAAVTVAPAPPAQPVGDSCSKDCGGKTVAIQCAQGETPVCDCAANPPAVCKVAEAGAAQH